MARAVELAAGVRATTSPNPWVGSVIVTPDGATFEGATRPPGGAHAEIVALTLAGTAARGATLYSTLEPCAHHGRTPPCTEAIISAGIARVVMAIEDPDPLVAGKGAERLRQAGVMVEIGAGADAVTAQLQAYLTHRSTGRPWVVLKMAATFDGRTAAPDGTSRWITGEAARADAHRLRAESDAVLVGAGTVRADDPSLTVRTGRPNAAPGLPVAPGPVGGADSAGDAAAIAPVATAAPGSDTAPDAAAPAPVATVGAGSSRQPQRVVLGTAPAGARIHPAWEMSGDLGDVLDDLGARGILQLLVEGGATVAHDFHAAGLVDRYVLYLAPSLFGGDDARPLFQGAGAPTIDDVWRGRIVDVTAIGDDLRVELAAGTDRRAG